jgi:pimeloyl-ACP methyl ester carboxylesterase
MERPAELEAWEARGSYHEIFGHRVFAVIEEPPGNAVAGDPLLVLHGFPSSSLDFRRALPRLARSRRVIVHDHLGFGLSSKPPGYSYSLVEQAEIAVALWRALGVTRGHLIAHDYGTSIATELVVRKNRGLLPFEIVSLTLCNGSVHFDLAHLTPSQRLLRNKLIAPAFARLASKRVFELQLRKIFGSPSSVSAAEVDAMWEALVRDGGRDRLPALAGYMDERVRFRDRWIGSLREIAVPSHVLWGRLDPIAVPAIAERLAQDLRGSKVTYFDDLGHYPMLEDPARWAEHAAAFVEGVELR